MTVLLRPIALATAVLAGFAGPLPAAADAPRIVSVGSDVTEILFAVGAGDRVVAADDTSRHPPPAAALPRVGYLRTLSAEGTLAQRPTLVLAGAGAGPDAVLAQLRGAGVRVEAVPEARSAEAVLEKIRTVARLAGREAEGRALADAVGQRLARAVPSDAPRPRALVLLATAPGRVLAGGRDTAADAVLSLAGLTNAFAGASGYKPLTPEAALAADPDLIVVPSHVVDGAGGRAQLLATPALAATRAVREGRIVVIESQKLLNFGPRLPDALDELRAAAGLRP